MKFRLRNALRNLVRKDEIETDLNAELRAYVELLADEKIAAGASRGC